MTNVAILGSGPVGEALANGFLKYGYTAKRASRDLAKLEPWRAAAKGDASVGTYAEAAAWAEIVVLCVKGAAAVSVLEQAGISNLTGKTVIDTTNPIADGAPDHGVVRYFTSANESLMERLQAAAPNAHLVKAFNSVGSAFMVDPPFKPAPTMFICGNDLGAKRVTTEILTRFGWETADMGACQVARPIEALCQLWCAPGFATNDWAHAFKYLKL